MKEQVNQWIADVWREECAYLDARAESLAKALEGPGDKNVILSKWMLGRIKSASRRGKCQDATTVRA